MPTNFFYRNIKIYIIVVFLCLIVFQLSVLNPEIKKKPEWMTPALLKSCRVISKLCKTYLKNTTPSNKIRFTNYRNRFKTIKQAIIRQHFSSKFQKQQGNPKGIWNIIKSISSRGNKTVDAPDIFYSGDGGELNSPISIVEKFNKQFSDLGQSLAKKIITPSMITNPSMNSL